MSGFKKGTLMAMISGMMFGAVPIMVTYCYAMGANSTVLLMIRFAIIVLMFFPVAQKKGNITDILKKHWRKFLCICCASASTALLLLEAYKYIATGLATTLHFLYPTVVVLICLVFFRDKISRFKLICLALCLGGMLLLLDMFQDMNTKGIILAMLSSVTYSLYIVWLDKLHMEDLSTAQLIFFVELGNLIIVGLVYGTATGTLVVSMTPSGWAVAIISNLFIAIFGQAFFISGVRLAGAQTAAIVSTLEPITSIAIGSLFMNEAFGLRTAAMTSMILAAVVLLAVVEKQK